MRCVGLQSKRWNPDNPGSFGWVMTLSSPSMSGVLDNPQLLVSGVTRSHAQL